MSEWYDVMPTDDDSTLDTLLQPTQEPSPFLDAMLVANKQKKSKEYLEIEGCLKQAISQGIPLQLAVLMCMARKQNEADHQTNEKKPKSNRRPNQQPPRIQRKKSNDFDGLAQTVQFYDHLLMILQ